MAIMNIKGDRASPWKIPLWVFVSAKLIPPAANSTIIIIIVHSLELFTSAIADGFSLGSEWQQVSSSLQDSS